MGSFWGLPAVTHLESGAQLCRGGLYVVVVMDLHTWHDSFTADNNKESFSDSGKSLFGPVGGIWGSWDLTALFND